MFVKASSHPATTGVSPHLSTRAYFPNSTANLFPPTESQPHGLPRAGVHNALWGRSSWPGDTLRWARPGDRSARGWEEQQLSGIPAVSVLLASNV